MGFEPFPKSGATTEIWRKTKKAADAAGSFTVDVLVGLAKGYIKAKIAEHTGIPL